MRAYLDARFLTMITVVFAISKIARIQLEKKATMQGNSAYLLLIVRGRESGIEQCRGLQPVI